jgi:flagellar protein FliL
MKLPLALVGVALGLIAGGGAGSYWYLAQARTAPADAQVATGPSEQPASEALAFIDMERKFVVPLVRDNRVRSLVVVDLRLEVRASGESRAIALKPKVRDAFLDTLYALAVAGAFDGDLYSNNVQDEMRARLLQAARQILQDDASAILIGELLRQDQ